MTSGDEEQPPAPEELLPAPGLTVDAATHSGPADDDAIAPPLRRILLWVAFDGADFHGFQRQRDLRTVAGVLEAAWLRFRGETITIRSSSRTDAAVHGRRMPATFETRDPLSIKGIRFGLDHRLDPDIAIVGAEEVPADFHVRHDAMGKRYVYRIWCGRSRAPTRRRDHWHVPWQLDVDAMAEAASHFVGEHDFAGFRTTACTARSTLRSLSRVAVGREGAEGAVSAETNAVCLSPTALGQLAVDGARAVVIVVEGNAFLHNMVRIIAGTLVEVGKGKLLPADIAGIIASRDRGRAGPTAPGHGLTLEAVFYGPYGARHGLAHKVLLARLRGHASGEDPA